MRVTGSIRWPSVRQGRGREGEREGAGVVTRAAKEKPQEEVLLSDLTYKASAYFHHFTHMEQSLSNTRYSLTDYVRIGGLSAIGLRHFL